VSFGASNRRISSFDPFRFGFCFLDTRILGVNIVTNGVLIPSSSASRGKESLCFNTRYLRRFVGKIEKCTGLVSAARAAQLLRVPFRHYQRTLQVTYGLEPVRIEDHRFLYFRKSDVEKLFQCWKSLIRSGEVLARLKIGKSQLSRLVKSGELKPAFGPGLDGSRVNRFLKSEVEELRRKRQSFKRKRARAWEDLSDSANHQVAGIVRQWTSSPRL